MVDLGDRLCLNAETAEHGWVDRVLTRWDFERNVTSVLGVVRPVNRPESASPDEGQTFKASERLADAPVAIWRQFFGIGRGIRLQSRADEFIELVKFGLR